MSVTLTPNITVGKAVAVSLGGVLGYCKGGNITRNAASIKVTNSRSGGYQQVKAGIKSAAASFEMIFNGDDAPTGMVEGAEVTIIFDSIGYEASESIANTTTTPAGLLITGQFMITSIKDTWQADGDYGYSVDADSTGPYTAVYTATGATPTT